MGCVADDIEEWLGRAAENLRQLEGAEQRHKELSARSDELAARLAELRSRFASELKDVERLEGVSLARLLVAVRGDREDALDRERAEAEAARYRVAEAEALLAEVHREDAAMQQRMRDLAEAPAAYAAALTAKEQYLTQAGGVRSERLLAMADERGRLVAEKRELVEAVQAAREARQALVQVQEELKRASGWSTYDTFFGGGALSSSIKHARIEDAAQAAAYADRCLAMLRTELADLGGPRLSAPQLTVDGLTRFVDIFFDNFFTDLAVRDRIKQAQDQVDSALRLVGEVRIRLDQRLTDTDSRQSALAAERVRLLF
jgi:DNA repair exonuclease SbcCD ATPase subunit